MPNALITNAVAAIPDTTFKATVKAESDKVDDMRQNSIAGAIDVGVGSDVALKHAVMLSHLLLGMKTDGSVATLKSVVSTWSADDCKSELTALQKSHKERLDGITKSRSVGYVGSVVLGPSFYRFANSEEQRVGRLAIGTAQQMLLKAVISIKSVRSGSTSEATSKYSDYFGPYDLARYTKVRKNVEKIHAVLTRKPVLLYYRGTRVGGIDDSGDFGGAASSTSSVAETWTDVQISNNTSNLHVYKTDPKCSSVSHIWLGTAAFEKGSSGPSSTGGKRSVGGEMSVAGTILHELSHFLCSTADEADPVCNGWTGNKCYGSANVKTLATTDQTKACNNADSYRYYFEQFQAV